ncbi:ABC transporter ATP-binding protein [Longimicrobium sp.]|uniref:ABC transporter ATP-binding protein n=1 Tax=Longimicrobium sp. TaxID=2029185 RepID=UPI003B3B6179
MVTEPNPAGAATGVHPLRRLIRTARPHRRQMWAASVCSVLNKLLDLAPEALIGVAVDVVVRGRQSLIASWGFPDPRQQLVVLAAITFVAWVLESLFQYLYGVLWRNLAQSVQHDLRLQGYAHLQDLDLAYFEERSTGGLMSVLGDDVNQLERFLDTGANGIIQITTTVLIVGATFFVMAPEVAWMAMLPMPFVVWWSIRYQRTLEPLYAAVREKAGAVNARLASNLSGVTTIKAYAAEEHEIRRVRDDSQAYRDANGRAIRYSAAFIPLIRILVLIGFTGTLVFGGFQVLDGALAVGTYSFLVYITQRLLWPLTRLGETLDQYQRAMASSRRIFAVLDTPAEAHPGHLPLPAGTVRGDVEMRGVTFAYRGREPVLHDFSLRIAAGETVAVVGPTGSGKSTLVKLLLRLYELDAGTVLVDGAEIRTVRLGDLRKAIGLVSQDVFLFPGTVRENIAYGSFGATAEQVERASRLAEAHDFITALPQGYETVVGERGQKLSGGQRQRIAIARAILKDPPILVLDEATSAVDNETEAAIQRSLEHISRDRTTIAIAHRLSTVRNAHRIYVMDRGRIVEQGRHEELVGAGGMYAALWRVQTGEGVSG